MSGQMLAGRSSWVFHFFVQIIQFMLRYDKGGGGLRIFQVLMFVQFFIFIQSYLVVFSIVMWTTYILFISYPNWFSNIILRQLWQQNLAEIILLRHSWTMSANSVGKGQHRLSFVTDDAILVCQLFSQPVFSYASWFIYDLISQKFVLQDWKLLSLFYLRWHNII